MSSSIRWLLVPWTILGLLTAACGSSVGKTAATTAAVVTTAAPTTTTVPALKGDITVFAASSLTAAFNEVGASFTTTNPEAHVTFSYDASSALVAQIIEGAPADLFASADTANMDKLTTLALNGTTSVVFATNLLQIIVAPGNPKAITGVADLAKADLKVVLCAPEVPCGKYANQILDTAKVTVTPASLEQNVKGVVTKVTAGEADAGIVYVTDVMAAGAKAAGVDIPADINVIAKYPIASVKASTHADVDQAFIDFLTGSNGQAILAKYGFGKP
ncbi:MAG: molybdate ABC transporter substrate-binding protein [Acidimicrobiales bacterium]